VRQINNSDIEALFSPWIRVKENIWRKMLRGL